MINRNTSAETQALEFDSMDTPDSSIKVFDAYPIPAAMRSSLSVIVPTVSFLSVIPAVLAWIHSANGSPGAHADSAFYQTITSSVLQLLSILTFVWPTMRESRLSRTNRYWIRVLAGISAVCAILSVPLYLYLPTIWSFVLAFVGAIAQAIVQLQVINSI
jgi:uncharacterized membrane protein